MSKAYTGGCACGAVRYEIAGEPLVMSHCQCRDCQRISGTGHGSYLVFKRDDMRLEGETSQWGVAADSGNVKTKAFCPTCGAPLHLTFAAMPDIVAVTAASLDEPERFDPQFVTYRVRAYRWDSVDPALKAFDRMPTG
jgi:hypothetical protein